MSTHLALFFAAAAPFVAVGADAPRRTRNPSNTMPLNFTNFHLKCITCLSYADAVDFIYVKRGAHQPFAREDCERLLVLLLKNKVLEFVPHGKDLKNAKIDKESLNKYMEEDGFGALVLLQLQDANPFAPIRPKTPEEYQ